MGKRDCEHVCYKELKNSKMRKDTKCEEVGQMNGKKEARNHKEQLTLVNSRAREKIKKSC